ncbi:acyl-CoA dehydrogenase family protein [Micromonospora sp. CPCC 206061]|uniref:acyl-CoA dehydrogenase family protein n=1 Tax=Micromonospora sp. CPCC 206061 TaxID=3122410 RepID=UPI002FF2941F
MTEERLALREAVRDLLRKDPDGHWPRLCGEIGAAGLAVPERFGGAGASLVEAHLVLEELGRGLTPSPFLGSAVLAAQALLATDADAACARLLPGIADGSRIAALVLDPGATVTRGNRLHGTVHHVLDGDSADVLLVAVSNGLYEVDTGVVSRTHTPALDLTRRLATVELRGAPGRLLGPCQPDLLRDIAAVALSAEQVGAASRALELTVEYTKTRVQFGRPIGAFQALQHRLADLYVLVESARSASYAAVDAIVAVAPDRAELAAVAAVHCTETLERVAAEMIQMHGGIGITWEHDAHRYFKRAHGTKHLFADPHENLARLAVTIFDTAPLE